MIIWKTEKRKISELKPAEYNPRRAGIKETEDLRKSLEKFNLADPIIINKNNTVIGGHFRLKILKEKGITTVDIRVPNRQLSDKEEKELNIRLNKNLGSWDFDMLANFDEEFLKEVGFESQELDKIFSLNMESQDDEVPEIKKETNIKLGDIFQLGKHRIMCGDSTKESDVKKLMEGKLADMVFTDPPYGVNYQSDQKILNKKSGNKFRLIARPIIGDNLSVEECAKEIWRPAFKNMYEFAKDECSFYMTMCQGGDQMMMMMMNENWQIKHELIWIKSSAVFSMGRLDYDYQHEPILYGWKEKHNFYGGGQFKKSVWEINKPSKSDLHPTMKPVELIENALLNSSQRGEICLDLFLGSGSTLIACEKTNRICYGMEIDPMYVQVSIARWEKFTEKG